MKKFITENQMLAVGLIMFLIGLILDTAAVCTSGVFIFGLGTYLVDNCTATGCKQSEEKWNKACVECAFAQYCSHHENQKEHTRFLPTPFCPAGHLQSEWMEPEMGHWGSHQEIHRTLEPEMNFIREHLLLVIGVFDLVAGIALFVCVVFWKGYKKWTLFVSIWFWFWCAAVRCWAACWPGRWSWEDRGGNTSGRMTILMEVNMH
jgi:hypothetical protein